jgi:general secretion pathway protein E
MVGEIRDNETADIAVRAALTGHLIFSTLHTNDAVSAIGRLLDMDVEPFLVASVLEGIIAQRLGRRLCRHCRKPEPIAEAVRHRISPKESVLFREGTAWGATGCDKCEQTGFKGRIGYYELLDIVPGIRAAITEHRTSSPELLAVASPSHVTMRHDGLIKAAAGETTVEEVLRATQDTEEMMTPRAKREGGVQIEPA